MNYKRKTEIFGIAAVISELIGIGLSKKLSSFLESSGCTSVTFYSKLMSFFLLLSFGLAVTSLVFAIKQKHPGVIIRMSILVILSIVVGLFVYWAAFFCLQF